MASKRKHEWKPRKVVPSHAKTKRHELETKVIPRKAKYKDRLETE